MKTSAALLATAGALVVAAAVAAAGSDGSVIVAGVPAFAAAAVAAFVIQWLVFVPSYVRRTERYFDLTGSLTYLALVAPALVVGNGSSRSQLIAVLVAIWAVRLGVFLFGRVRRAGVDRRFDVIKTRFAWFLMTWTLQGLWVFLTLGAGLAAMTGPNPVDLGGTAAAGVVLWLAGFGIEVTADRQKRAFRADPANAETYISSGLWAWSRHPNYFGEVVLWAGVTLIAVPVLTGWQWVTAVSPLFVYVLLTRVSGVPMLEVRAQQRWGDDPDYQAYVNATSVFFPRPPRARSRV